MRIAVYSPVPLDGPIASPSIRLRHLARALGRDHDVSVLGPATDGLTRFDVVLAQRLPPRAAVALAATPTRVVYDLYTPTLPEALAAAAARSETKLRRLLVEAELLAERIALATGDAFVCTSERQRDFWIGALGALGRLDLETYRRDRTLRDVIDVVPFGVPESEPRARRGALKGVVEGVAPTDRVLLWLGGIVEWTDPLVVIRAVARLVGSRPDVRLVFVGAQPPSSGLPHAAHAAREEAERLGLVRTSVFFVNEWVEYDRRDAYLVDADIAVAAYRNSVEARLAFRARFVDHFWAGLPTVTTLTDDLGEQVVRRGLGRAVPAGDVDAYAAALVELLDDKAAYDAAAAAAAALREELAWTRVVEPLRRIIAGAASPPRARTAQLVARSLWLRARISAESRGAGGALRKQVRRRSG